jgi:hypothetical protein
VIENRTPGYERYDVRNAEIHLSHATPMTHERSLDELVYEFSAKARAEGRYDGRAFWEVPPRPGSILDVPETPESRERIAWLLKRIAELKQEAAKGSEPVQEIRHEASRAIQAELPPKRKRPADHVLDELVTLDRQM